ncbi:MAG: hypothetical protein JO196_20095 [Hyphomicrobiales bacterium]|nr:hypothetical protein [Hyphomicrobiales bacterium]MBV9977390.1 hypothetical protein [Hyphomicrobiales bacterium]
MLDGAWPRAGADGASRSAPAGEILKRARENRGEVAHAIAGATGELLVTRPLSSTSLISREPRSAFLGVMLKVPGANERGAYVVVLAAKDDREDLVLARDLGKDDVVARWRGLAASLGLPPVLRHANGEIEFLHMQLGAIALGRGSPKRRRRHAVNRRSRFLMRRKAGHALTAKA